MRNVVLLALDQEAGDHHTFIAENKDNWKTVRVFDTYVE